MAEKLSLRCPMVLLVSFCPPEGETVPLSYDDFQQSDSLSINLINYSYG